MHAGFGWRTVEAPASRVPGSVSTFRGPGNNGRTGESHLAAEIKMHCEKGAEPRTLSKGVFSPCIV